MSDEKRKPTPEEKAQAAAEARVKAEALRKLREQEASGEHTADEAPVTAEPVQAQAAPAPAKPVSEMTAEEKAAAKAAAAAEAIAKAKAAKEAKDSEVTAPAKPVSEMTAEEKAAAKAAAAAEAIAKAKATKEAKEAAAPSKPVSEMTPEEKAAAKAAAAAEALAKAKAAKEAKEAAAQGAEAGDAGSDADAKAKAAAAAKAKAAAAAAAKAKAAREAGADAGDAGGDNAGGDDAKAKAAAAAKAKAAAAAAAKAKGAQATDNTGGAEEAPKAPSKNQPYLDKYISRLTEAFGPETLEASYINELAKEVPTLVIKNDRWHEVAQFLKEDEQLGFDYLSDLHGVDYEDRMEVYYHFYSYKNRQSVAVKVKTDREQSAVPSVMDIWYGANWNERETFDLLGIHFPGHRDMRRILLPDDWVGYPLRKDYVQYDEEV